MSRLDRHVAMVQNKLAVGRFVQALAWASVFFAAALWIGIVVDRVFRVRPPGHMWWVWGGVGACVLAALVYAIIRRPSKHDAAVAIDEKLALKEKFSTALYARSITKDPFAAAAVKDAERTAENVSLHRRFPLEFPRQSLGTVGIGVLVALTLAFLPRMDLFGKEADRQAKAMEQQKNDDARRQVEKALQVIVETQAKGVAEDETINQAKKDLQAMLQSPTRDPDKLRRSAARALADVDQALKQQIANNQRVADANNDAKAFKSITPPSDEKGPVADAQRKIAKGEFADAVDELSKAVEKFDKMTEEEQKKAAQQMQQMANQLQQLAQPNAQQQQQQQQQLQQLGLNQQQAQAAQQMMQQAAQGDKQAQQQLQQMAQQAMQQMNNGQGPNQQQKQQMQQMMQQMQAQANTQQQAQQMQQAAQQMAQAMKQQAQQQQGGQQGGGGQQQGQQNQQQMAQGQQQMQQQLNAMQAMKADAQQVQAAQNAAAQAAADAAAACNGGGQGQQGQQANQGQNGANPGQWNNNMNQQFQGAKDGARGGGVAAGDRTFKETAPYAVKEEISQSQDIEGGKILASTLIKAKSIKGESTVGTAEVAPPPEQEATDEVEQERITRPAQEAVKKYFEVWQTDSQQ